MNASDTIRTYCRLTNDAFGGNAALLGGWVDGWMDGEGW